MKYALVTGGSRGLGRAICLKLAGEGIPVIINYQSSDAAAEEVKALCEEQGVAAELMKCDVSNMEAVDAAIDMMNRMKKVAVRKEGNKIVVD